MTVPDWCRRRAVAIALATVLLSGVAPSPGIAAAIAPSADAAARRHRALLVLYRSDALDAPGTPGAALRPATASALRDALDTGYTTNGVADSGGLRIVLDAPVTHDHANRLLNRLRHRPDVVWAELDPADAETAATKSAALARRAAPAAVAQLVVTLAAPDTRDAARANRRLGADWDERLSRVAGSPLAIVRPTVGGAWIVRLVQPMRFDDASAVAAKLVASGLARFADPDLPIVPERIPDDPHFGQGVQWSLVAPATQADDGGRLLYGIGAPAAWDITTGDPGLVVAIVDSGVLPHPEFAGRLLQGYDFVSDPAKSRDGLGRHPGGSDPGNWSTGGDCPGTPAYNSDWHGTAVAGVAVATGDDGSGIAGLNWKSRILPVRVTGICSATTSDVVAGLHWAAGLPVPGVPDNPNPARVINMSVGTDGPCTPQMQAGLNEVLARGTFISVSVGNGADLASGHTPGGSCLGIVAVSATDRYGNRAPYSNFGPGIDIAAPAGDGTATPTGGVTTTYNLGTTVPGAHSYASLPGTSIASPHVAGVASLMLSVNPALTPAAIKALLVQQATPFPASSSCLTIGCGAGILNAGAAVSAALPAANYGGMWWNAPAGSEAGWGINFAHQGDTIFATWFTYGFDGKPLWLVFAATRTGAVTYSGNVYTGTGPAFNAVPFDPVKVVSAPVGTASVTFTDRDNATFSYDVSGVAQSKAITREIFAAPVPACAAGGQEDAALAGNFQDLWWNAPGGSEAGWGINLTHQGDTIFASWFTFDVDGTPLWLVFAANRTGPHAYAGDIYTATGPAFDAAAFDTGKVIATKVGSATLAFDTGASADFGYTVRGVAQSKRIVREVFAPPGTVCR